MGAARNEEHGGTGGERMNHTGTATEMLAEFILYNAGARLLRMEAATSQHPSRVYFCSHIPGDAPECVLPLVELSQRNVRHELAKFRLELVAVGERE